MPIVDFRGVGKEYAGGGASVTALRACSFTVEQGELAVLTGPSGAGKTTILNLLGGMDTPTGGSIYVDGARIDGYNKRQLTAYRRRIGFVFQFYNLVANLTAEENVKLACRVCPGSLSPRAVLERVGLADRCRSLPAQLSGGEQQRVAIARAVAKKPKLLLCDEPTGALDSGTGRRVLALLQNICKALGVTTILITHSSAVAAIADRLICVKNGAVTGVTLNARPQPAEAIAW
ncbi:MAG: ABC transporter ATP-binding protein [Oscillospiraceae bacterium]|jgi:putative ABC transport system ATP-binding protein|nr:ABC transporter ATP-binding protein [Oscillospiraceae bacterium]